MRRIERTTQFKKDYKREIKGRCRSQLASELIEVVNLLVDDLELPGGANINLQMAGPTLQAMCALLNQLREHAAWGDVPQVIEADEVKQDLIAESKKPLVH